MMNLYDTLRDLRKLKGYTIRELATRSGVSPAYISQLENGNRGIPSPDVLMKLSEGLSTSYASLMQTAGYLQTDQSVADKRYPILLRRFLRENDLIFDGIELTEEHKEWIERMLTALFWREQKHIKQEE